MAVAAPPRLSELAELLLRRPPSLRELVVLVGNAEDHAWFVGLVRRLFPDEAEAVLTAPDIRQRVEGFARLFEEPALPPLRTVLRVLLTEEDEPPFTVLRRGIPYDLQGIGYEGLHEMWGGYRDGLSALALLAKPPESFYTESDEVRVPGWSRPPPTSRSTRCSGYPKAAYPWRLSQRRSRGPDSRGPPKQWAGSGLRRATCSWTIATKMGPSTASPTPGDDEVIAEGTEEWRRARAVLDPVNRLAEWLEEDLPARFAEMLDFILERLGNSNPTTEESDHE